MAIYSVAKIDPGGILFMKSAEFGGQVWVLVHANRVTAGRLCGFCEEPISAGDACYRPLGSANNRMERVHRRCADLDLKSAIGRHQLFPEIYPDPRVLN